MRKGLSIALFFMPLFCRAASVLWISVAEDATITNQEGVKVLVSEYQDENGLKPNAARISIASDGGVVERFLSLYYEDEEGWTTDPDYNVAELDGNYALNTMPVDFGGISGGGGGSVSFELGYIDFDDDSSTFTALAKATETASQLESEGHVSRGDIEVPTQKPWSPFNFDTITPEPVPEPASAALLAMGIAALALRRRAA